MAFALSDIEIGRLGALMLAPAGGGTWGNFLKTPLPWRHSKIADAILEATKLAFMDIWAWFGVPLGSIMA